MIPAVRRFVLCILCFFSVVPCFSGGLESAGNTDGVLTWRLGDLAPGGTVSETVFLLSDDSYEHVADMLNHIRENQSTHPEKSNSLGKKASQASVQGNSWLETTETSFALGSSGAFFWEGDKQSLFCNNGGQLSRLGYFIHYGPNRSKHAGTSIHQNGQLQNLHIIQPVQADGSEQLTGMLETDDGWLRIVIQADIQPGPVVRIGFCIVNTGSKTVENVYLSVYTNLESNHTHDDDYSILDRSTEALVVSDLATGHVVCLAGLHTPKSGYSGTWASSQQLETGNGIEFEKWQNFKGLRPEIVQRLGKSIIPHPPAQYGVAGEPPVRTLSDNEAQEVLQTDWLFQACDVDLTERALSEIGWARELAARLLENPQTPSLDTELNDLEDLEGRLIALRGKTEAPNAAETLYYKVREAKRRIVFKNPAVDFERVLFIDNPYPQGAEWPHQARHRNGMMAVPGGRLLVLDGLHPGGTIRKLAPETPGSFWRPDLSFDAQRVLFCFWAEGERSFHLYEINLDGTGLRQLTFGEYDDIDPIYLPDGKIAFTTTRCNTYVRCMPYTYSYILARCDADGQNIYLLSRNNEPDWLPTLLNDGRMIYSRWEYTDKALWRIQSLWTTNQDGTNTAVFWGNQSVWPDHLTEARPIPGSPRVMFTGVAHHNWFDGSIGIIDPREGFNFPHGLTKVTCDIPWPECGEPPSDVPESPDYHVSGGYTAYKTPYPLSEKDFLVSARGPDDKFRLYLMDTDGNRELIYEGVYNIWHAMPIKPRLSPPYQPDRVAWPGTGDKREETKPGYLYSSDIYRNVPDLPRGSAKYIRVLQIDPKTASSWTRDSRFSGPGTSILQDDGVKRILGTAPINDDGSVYVEVPAGKALHFQVLDERYRALQTMRTFTGVMPGEVRGCVGCHEMHSVAPVNAPGEAVQREVCKLDPPPWGSERTISYEGLVQPVLDRYCGECHQGGGKAQQTLDLTLRPSDQWFFKEPYVTLVGKCWPVASGFDQPSLAGAMLIENFDQSEPESYATFRPGRYLSPKSRLIDIAMSGMHHEVKVDPVSLRQLIGWVDANCPYRGEDEIRAVPDPEFAGVDLLPVRPRCRTAPIVQRP